MFTSYPIWETLVETRTHIPHRTIFLIERGFSYLFNPLTVLRKFNSLKDSLYIMSVLPNDDPTPFGCCHPQLFIFYHDEFYTLLLSNNSL